MGLFGSSKKSSTKSTQTDNRRVLGERALSNELGGTLGAFASQSLTNNYTSIDGGAFDMVDGVVGNAVGAVGAANQNSLNFADSMAGRAMDLANASTAGALGRSLGFADGAMSQAMDLANTSTAGALGRSLGFADGAMSNAFGIAGDSTRNSLQFADGAMLQAMDLAGTSTAGAMRNSLAFADGAMNTAVGTVGDMAGRSMSFADGVMSQALSVVGDAMNQVRGALSTATDAASSSAGMAKDAYADAKGRGAMTDYLLLAALVVVGIVAVRARST